MNNSSKKIELNNITTLQNSGNTIKTLDLKHVRCPELINHISKIIRKSASHSTYEIYTLDSTSQHDIPRLCKFLNYSLLRAEIVNNNFYYVIHKP